MKPIALALLAVCLASASAQEPGRYQVSGREPGWGAFRGEVVLEASGGRLRYAGAVRWADGTAGALRGAVLPGPAAAVLTEELVRSGGLAGALGGVDVRRRVGALPAFVGNRAQASYADANQAASWRQRSRVLRLRVMSFNVLGFKADWLGRAGRVAKAIRDANPDLVCLQETVGQTRGRSTQVNSLAKRAGGYRTRFEGYRKYSFLGPWMGNAVLSRWRIADFARVPLPRGPKGFGDYPRGLTWARVAHPSGALLDVGSLHLHQRNEPADRALRVEQARAATRSGSQRAGAALRLLVGDYNARPTSETYRAMRDAGWRDLWSEARPGDPGYTGSVLGVGSPKRIDYVFARPPGNAALEALRARLVGPRTRGDSGELISDHKALVVELSVEVPVGP
ncbi:MAG: endonuclease/exonuclease/phosphatase family protein [Planctomycetes bacterium]|nr:endonuclease/exonuclease/phosphatase family protein [Planctomycetota bacterium]